VLIYCLTHEGASGGSCE